MAKTELEEAGLETEGMVESTAKLRQEILALSGIDIMEDADTFKSTYAIMDELAAKWKDLTDIQQASVTELIAGKRQGNIVSSLMNNFDIARSALETSLKSSGSAMREHEKWQESLEARINSLKASWQSLSQTFMSSKGLKIGIDLLTGLVDTIDSLIDHFGVFGTAVGGIGLSKIFKKGFVLDESGNQIGKYAGLVEGFSGLGDALKTDIGLMKAAASQSGTLGERLKRVGSVGKQAGTHIGNAFKASGDSIKAMAKDIGILLAVMGAMKAISDIATWVSDAGEEAETAAEKFDKISDELSDVDSELSGLESELSSVESQIDALLAKDELTFAEEEELEKLQDISRELEHQIELTETLQKSLQKSQSKVALSAYGAYASDTSFYSDESKADRIEANKTKGSAIGNIAGLIAGGVIAYLTGGTSLILAGAGIGSVLGSAGGSFAGGNLAKTSYDNETTVRELLDNMEAERFRLEKARDEAYEAYANDKYNNKKIEAWEEAEAALSSYNAALSKHMSQLSEYYNSIDYASLDSAEEKADYLKMGDDLDKYNIAMGVKGAKSTAFDRIFSDELITEEAKQLRGAIEATLNSGEKINFEDFDSEQFKAIKERFADIGVTIYDCVYYLEDFKEKQEEISNHSTYDMVSNIALLSDGVTSLTDAFAEFNEQGIVSSKTLTELNEVFGSLGEDWTNYVDVMTNGISTIEDAREATEKLVESYTGDIFKNGGIKFQKFNKETNEYEFDDTGYKTYLSTINQLEGLGVENAKEYADALQQQAMIREAASKITRDSAEKEALLAKETLTEKENTRLSVLEGKKIDDYILEIESSYGIRLKDSGLIKEQYVLNEYKSKSNEYQKYLADIEGLSTSYTNSLEATKKYHKDQEELQKQWSAYAEDGYGNSGASWKEAGSMFGEAFEKAFGSWLGFDIDTEYDKFEKIDKEYQTAIDLAQNEKDKREEFFVELVKIAEESDIDLSGIDINGYKHALTNDEKTDIFNQVYERVKSNLNTSIDAYEKNIVGLTDEIEERLNNLGLEIDFGRNFNKIVIDGFKSSLEQLGTALSESISGSGLSIDSMNAIEDIFGDLDGFDASKLFENTANGIRLNRNEFRKLNDEMKTSNIDNVEDRMSELEDRYKQTKERLHDCTVGTEEYNSAIRDLSYIEEQIAASEELLSQYKGVFSAYQEWQRMEASGQERDMYENLIKGFENIDNEISRGWLDDGTVEFLELLTGKDLSTAPIKDLKDAYNDLDKAIGKSGYSIRDFFTVNEDGESTNTGVYNFLETIETYEDKLGDVINRKDGRIVGFNFEVAGGNEAIAKTLGVSEELVEIMVRASDDAGFVVDVDGAVTQISYLKEQAEDAVESLILLKDKGLKELEGINVDFNLDADGGDLNKQYASAIELLNKFKKDGKINLSMDGAQEALDVAKYLTIRIDELTEPRYMQIDMSSVEDSLREPIKKMQEFEEASNRKHLLTLTGDTEGLKDVDAKMEEISGELSELDDKTKLKLGIDTDWTREQIAEALEKGEIEIPAQVEIGVQMSDDLKDIRLMMMKQLGLASDGEVKLKIGYNIDDSVVDNLTDKEQEIIVKYVAENEEKFKALTKEEQEVVIKYVAKGNDLSKLTEEEQKVLIKFIGDDSELKDWTPEQKEALVKYIVDGGEVEKWTPEQKLAFAKYLVDGGNVEGWSPEAKEAFVKYLVDGGDPEKFDPENKESWVVYKADTEEPEEYNPTPKTQQVTADLDASEVENYQPKSKTVTIWTKIKNWFTGDDEGGSVVNGTANVNGTTGRAFKQGSWGTKNSGTALVGELGREVLVRDGKYYTIGDSGAEFIKYKKGDIIFNHIQSEQLFRNGKVTAGGGRAKALAGGTSFAQGTAFVGGSEASNGGLDKITQDVSAIRKETEKKSGGSSGSGGGLDKNKDGKGVNGKSKSGSGSSTKDDFKETFDFVEIAISRMERAIDQLDQTAGATYKSWSARNNALTKEIGKVRGEIDLQEKAYNRYMQEANKVGLSSSWKKKVQNGTVDISTIKDEGLAEKIKEYQKWYELALKSKDAVQDLKDKESELYIQRFDNIAAKYEAKLNDIENQKSIVEENIKQSDYDTGVEDLNNEDYKSIIALEKKTITQLKAQKKELEASLAKAVEDGTIEKYSEEWYTMKSTIDNVALSIEQSTTNILTSYEEMFDGIAEKYNSTIGLFDSEKSISEIRNERSKYDTSVNSLNNDNYDDIITQETNIYNTLAQQKREQENALKDLEKNGYTKGSKKWNEKKAEINNTTLQMEQAALNISNAYSDMFDNVSVKYDGILQGFEHTETMLNEYISQAETDGHIISTKYYQALADNEESNISSLKSKQAELIAARDKAVEDGKVTKYSQEWYRMCGEIDNVTQAIENGATKLKEYDKAMRQIEWDKFDMKQEHISDVTAESDFMIKLMSSKDMHDDKGNLTAQGAATLGLHGLNHNTYMYQADDYAAQIADIDRRTKLDKNDKDYLDPNSKDVINRRRELVKLQQDSILAAEGEKQAIKDLVEEGINKELDALQELIDKKNEALQSEKDLYEYQKKVKEQTEEIASLEKQIAAYENDSSEEAKAKIQELKVSLEDAEENLRESEWDKYIQDTSALLDSLYTEYETILNTRLDNIDDLLSQVVSGINASMGEGGTIDTALGSEGAIATAIANTVSENGGMKTILNTELGAVGTTLSTAMDNIWTTEGTGTNSVLATYGEGFQNKQTTTNQTLGDIKTAVDNMASDSDDEADKQVDEDKTSPSSEKDPIKKDPPKKEPPKKEPPKKDPPKKDPPKKDPPKKEPPKKEPPKKKTSGDGVAKVGDKVKFISGKYYYDSEGKSPIGSKNLGKEVYITKINTKSWATHPYHISTGKTLGKGDLGWLKLNQISGYATGKKKVSDSQYAWTQENGLEYIVRPSDGAILTPVAKGDSVLNATASGNIWSMANNPTEFIKNNLGLDAANVPSGVNVQSNYTQHLDKVVFNLPNVKNYDELLAAMQKDKNFERLILSMSIDRLAGKSGLAKGKSIR